MTETQETSTSQPFWTFRFRILGLVWNLVLGIWYFARVLLVGIVVTSLVRPAWGQPVADEAVESARRSLDGPIQFPWYDAQEDRVKPIEVRPSKDAENRRSAQPWAIPDWFWSLLEILGWAILTAAIVLFAYALVRAFLSDEVRGSTAAEADPQRELAGDVDRMESLPFAIKRPQSDLLAEARRLYEAGDFGQAIVYLYSHQLVQLDKHQMIRLAKGKTNRQYLREMRSRSAFADLLEQTMVAFEDVFFGRHRLDRARFESCWNRIDEFHQQLEQAAL